MALRVWLPLNGTLENRGISDVTVTNNGATVDNNGKIGKCYSFDGSNDYLTGTYNAGIETSFAAWIYLPTLPGGKHIFDARTSSGTGYQPMYLNNASIQIGSSGSGYATLYYTWTANTWYHVCVTHNATEGRCYINGSLIGSSTTAKGVNLGTCNFTLGSRCNQSNYSNVKLNDVRIYDHCLSAKEVKEISQGLILHYKLDNPYSSDNLIENGYGENGTTNWTSSYRSTTEIPSGHPEIKASFYGGNMTVNYIPVISSHSYTISGYIKSSGATSGTTYPSIYPYDIDEKFIYNRNSRIGFNLTTATTLTQPLKPGDTVIHVADLSKWNSNSGHYYNYCAIFGYEDSTGYVYPDFEYTQDLGIFGSSTNEKSNLDKQNNKITLISAYEGSFHPAGTAVCASTDGSTYYYPFGGIALSSLSDWVFKTATFIPQNDDRLRWSRYWKWSTYNSCYIAGNKLVDNTFISDTIKDSSGYENDGTVLGNSYINSDSSRYQISAYFDGVDDGILIENLNLSPIINDQVSYSFWIKPEGENGGRSVYFGSWSSTSWSVEKTAGNVLRLYWNGSPDETCSGATITDGTWQHIVITKNGANNIKVYINGVQKWTSTAAHNTLSFPTTYRIGRDTRTGDGTPYHGLMSDFRIYATALSAEDILDLYHTPASIDNLSNAHAFEFVEDDSAIKVEKNGIFKNKWSEGLELKTLSDGSIWAKIFYFDYDEAGAIWTPEEAKWCSKKGKYSCLGDLDKFIPESGWYEFWYTEQASGSKFIRWKQSYNPLSRITSGTSGTSSEYQFIDGTSVSSFTGLTRFKQEDDQYCYLRGYPTWWGAIAPYQTNYDVFPSMWGGSTGNHYQELWINITENQNISKLNSNGQSISLIEK